MIFKDMVVGMIATSLVDVAEGVCRKTLLGSCNKHEAAWESVVSCLDAVIAPRDNGERE